MMHRLLLVFAVCSVPVLGCAASSEADSDGTPAPSEDDLNGATKDAGPTWPAITFKWSAAGKILGMTCIRIYEPADKDGRSPSFSATANQASWQFHRAWQSDYLCTDRDYGLRWSFAGPLPGMHCINVNEPAEPAAHTWADNYLCAPEDYRLSWSSHDPIPGQACVQINDPWESHTWGDNYLCQQRP